MNPGVLDQDLEQSIRRILSYTDDTMVGLGTIIEKPFLPNQGMIHS